MMIRNYLTLTYVSLRLTLLSFPCSSAFSLSQPSITSIHFPSTTMQLKESRVNFHSFDAQYDRRKVLMNVIGFGSVILGNENVAFGAQFPEIDVNNALAREYTAFPGLYPTIATKIVNGAKKSPYTSKNDVYAILSSDAERERLKEYDSSIKIKPVDKALQQFKTSQICKYECGNRVSSSYRDDQIKEVQAARGVTSSTNTNEEPFGSLLKIDL